MCTGNARARDIFLYTDDELIGAEIEILVPDRFASGHRDVRLMRSARGKSQATGLVEGISARRKDGTEFPITAQISLYGDSDQLVVFIQECSRAGGL